MSTYRRPGSEPKPERLFNVTVAFRDDEPDLTITKVLESELLGMYRVLGAEDARMQLQTSPGNYYFTAENRVKHMTASFIEEKSK